MPETGSIATFQARPTVRDPAAKLLALLDFSAARGGEEALEDTLSVLLFSLMGEFAAPGAAVLLDDGAGGLYVQAAKGRGAATLGGRRIDVACDPLDEAPRRARDLATDHPLARLGEESALDLFVPIRHHGRTLGLLALGARATRLPWLPAELDLVRLVGGIAGTVVANHRLLRDLKTANRSLQRRVFDLHTIFDVSEELARACEPEAILRVFAQTAMAHTLVSQCVILLAAGEHLEVAFSRGVTLSAEERVAIEAASTGGNPEDSVDAPDTLARVEAILARSGIARLVPFRASSATRGYLGLGMRKNGQPLVREDLELISTLGHQAVTALDNLKFHLDRARREQLEREIRLARDIQTALFPRELPQLEGYRLHALSEPCFEVGGDYYDAMALDSGLLLAVGDVAGKGIPAALLMSTLQATIRSVGRRPGEHPAQILHDLNRNLVDSTHPGKFVTFFLASLDVATHCLTWSNAGHNWPYLVRASGQVERLRTGGTVLGIIPDVHYEEGHTTIAPGDLLFVFTDGVTEAMDGEEREYGEERLEQLLIGSRTLLPAEIAGHVLAAVREHTRGIAAGDDLTILALRRAEEGR